MIHTSRRLGTSVRICTYMCTYLYVHMYVFVCTYVCTYVHVYIIHVVCCVGNFKGKTVHTFVMCAHFADVHTLHLMLHCG